MEAFSGPRRLARTKPYRGDSRILPIRHAAIAALPEPNLLSVKRIALVPLFRRWRTKAPRHHAG
jgi:hypothetical protein